METPTSPLDDRLRAVERRLRLVLGLCLVETLALAAGAALVLPRLLGRPDASVSVLYARGVVIEDAQARPRILLGAPFPVVAHRKRQDATSAALLFLNEHGFDRLIVGEGIAPQVAGRVLSGGRKPGAGSGYGLTLHDGEGNERGGLGFLPYLASGVGGGRATIALDRPSGDAWGALVDDRTAFAGMLFNYPMPAGTYQSGIEMGVAGEKPFIHFKDKEDNTRSELAVTPAGVPTLEVFDARGRRLTELLQTSRRR
jgi:hypothetical protein